MRPTWGNFSEIIQISPENTRMVQYTQLHTSRPTYSQSERHNELRSNCSFEISVDYQYI